MSSQAASAPAPAPAPKGDSTFQDRILYCRECREPFVFSASEQRFFQRHGLRNDPKRCWDCRQKRKQETAAVPK